MNIDNQILISVISLVGTILSVFGGYKLVLWRLEKLEQKVEKHNNIIERVFILEEKVKNIEKEVEK